MDENDLEERREVDFEEANKFAKEKNIPYIEVSAKTGLYDGNKNQEIW